eukprot:CAMPEP_0172628868 /NCGR_PEP_ID=MMETSP1068-20121228/164332_1 /TAXON_ID=35684 /ORGANISM="Pseudopedinella elastica, Strain CCMP716" /LENGTH=262 /DNA_ID=CAMNT_0013439229 /DNA_START=121 /DNA_END=909 /DNA_ORIENTATION=-
MLKDDCDDPESMFVARCGSPVSIWEFHIIEFTATFIFSVAQACALLFNTSDFAGIYENPDVLRIVLVFSVAFSFIPTFLIWLNIQAFEVWAHEIEYSNEITMSFIDIVLFLSLTRQKGNKFKSKIVTQASSALEDTLKPDSQGYVSLSMAFVAAGIAVLQLLIYNGMGIDEDGERKGEKSAHDCEFAFEIISAFVTFWFCVENKCSADREMKAIMFRRESSPGQTQEPKKGSRQQGLGEKKPRLEKRSDWVRPEKSRATNKR